MKSIKKHSEVNSSISKQSGTGSVYVTETISSNILKTVDILNAKGYTAEYCQGDSNTSDTPFILFGSKVNDFTFAKTPFESNVDMLHGKLIIKFGSEAGSNRMEELFRNSSLVLSWAKRLKDACTIYCEIDVPVGEDPEEFFNAVVAEEFSVEELDYDGPFDVEDEDDPEYTLTFYIIVSPQMVKPIARMIRKFGQSYGVLATVTECDSF